MGAPSARPLDCCDGHVHTNPLWEGQAEPSSARVDAWAWGSRCCTVAVAGALLHAPFSRLNQVLGRVSQIGQESLAFPDTFRRVVWDALSVLSPPAPCLSLRDFLVCKATPQGCFALVQTLPPSQGNEQSFSFLLCTLLLLLLYYLPAKAELVFLMLKQAPHFRCPSSSLNLPVCVSPVAQKVTSLSLLSLGIRWGWSWHSRSQEILHLP